VQAGRIMRRRQLGRAAGRQCTETCIRGEAYFESGLVGLLFFGYFIYVERTMK
jgi:hypothetical protein